MPVKAGYLALTGAGAIFIWSGLKGKSVTDVFHALIDGQSPASAKAANSITSPDAGSSPAGSGGGLAGSGPVPNPSQAQQYAFSLFPQYGWGTDQQQPLKKLWDQESGWRWNAKNPSSGAYGIPQSLPASKMASAGSDWQTNPETQIKWGLKYIHDVYVNPAGAWEHEKSAGWY